MMVLAGVAIMESIASWVAPVATTIAALMTASNLGSRITGLRFHCLHRRLAGVADAGDHHRPSQSAVAEHHPDRAQPVRHLALARAPGENRGRRGRGAATKHRPRQRDAVSRIVAHQGQARRGRGRGSRRERRGHAWLPKRAARLSRHCRWRVAGVGETLRRVEWRDARVEGDHLVTTLTQSDFARADPLDRDQWPGR